MASSPNLIRYFARPPKDIFLKQFRHVLQIREHRQNVRLLGQSVGFVPTMGALHDGHIALINHAVKECKQVYVSIYVNPTQFGVNEDFGSYPQTLESDLEQLRRLFKKYSHDDSVGQLAAVFTPTTKEMYPGIGPSSEIDGQGSFVNITPLSTILEGASRPVFFRGVATVCIKLFNIIQPDMVYFGQKDVQQTYVIKRMVKDFHLDTKVRVVPTVREKDGLAMSSRNVYLGRRRRKVAIVLLTALRAVRKAFINGVTRRDELIGAAKEVVNAEQEKQEALPPAYRAMFEVDYFSLADPGTLTELQDTGLSNGAVLSGAIKMLPIEEPQIGEDTGVGGGKTVVRLIDNLNLEHIPGMLLRMAEEEKQKSLL